MSAFPVESDWSAEPVGAGPSGMKASRWGLIISLGLFLGLVVGGTYGFVTPPQFTGRSDFLIDSAVDLSGGEGGGTASDRDVATQAEILGNQTVRTATTAAMGMTEYTATVSSSSDSNIISVSVSAASPAETEAALAAYREAYLSLVGEQQSAQLERELSATQSSVEVGGQQVAQLDAEVRRSSSDERAIVIAQQSAQRVSIASDVRDGQEKIERLQSALKSLPVNIQVLSGDSPINPDGLQTWQWAVLGGALGAGAGAVVALRISERRAGVK